ncbi:MAG TPA: aminotransferase class III-fold pyridoxal phosphate-dependent enzyme, partial [Candidatus Hydrogenedentes bacterium]|nr:aminotransferase class III-fold pyridoxal phosphate-dependent enzyme [Candidatus Hydrogenedentota bacterium]
MGMMRAIGGGKHMIFLNDMDRSLVRELGSFLPEALFDAHAHLWRVPDLGGPPSDLLKAFGDATTVADWQQAVGDMVAPSRVVGALFMPWVARNSAVASSNAYLLEQLERHANCRGAVVVTPECAPAEVETLLEHPHVVGFKPYHCYASQAPTFHAPLQAFLPEWVWQLADERGLSIIIHLVRDRALAEPENHDELRRMCRRYPRARAVLAHAGRGFHAPNTVAAVGKLRGLENVYFDTSAICESAPLVAVLREFGPRKVLWGTDFAVSHQRGRAVTIGDGFAWVAPERVDDGADAPACHPTLVGIESLRALKEAADVLGLDEADLADIFSGNALRLFGLIEEPGTLTHQLYEHAKERFPGGTQLLSKRPELFAPGQWPAYFREARGCEVWDLDGRHYHDFSIHGIGSCLLGYRDPDVTRAVQRRVNLGSMSILNPPDEVALADRLCDIHSWAERVRFTRTGGEAAAVGVRIARATTRRDLVAICGYHGWHDWYLAANLGEEDALMGHLLPGLDPLGVPAALRGTALTFPYNDRDAFEAIVQAHGDRLAAVIMEPMRYDEPERGFLE